MDEGFRRQFNCLHGHELSSLGLHAVAAVQAHAKGGQDRGQPVPTVCTACVSIVMLHAAAVALRASTIADIISCDEFLDLASKVYRAHFALDEPRVEKLRELYAESVHHGLLARLITQTVNEVAATAAPAVPKEKQH